MGESFTTGAAVAGGAKLAKEVGRWAWNHQDEIEGKLKLLYRNLRKALGKEKPGVLILGSGGAAKTTLGRMLSGRYDFLLDGAEPYLQSERVQTFRHRGAEIFVAPGQGDRVYDTWPQLLAYLATGKAIGVILCGAYGYHALTSTYKALPSYKRGDDERTFLNRYLPARRAHEIAILKEIATSLANSPKTHLAADFGGKGGPLGIRSGLGTQIL
jgi:hypothetical protein